jgi:hypothetical protein
MRRMMISGQAAKHAHLREPPLCGDQRRHFDTAEPLLCRRAMAGTEPQTMRFSPVTKPQPSNITRGGMT